MTEQTSIRTSTALQDLVSSTFATLEAKDIEAIMPQFVKDAVLIDPHFPKPRMQGKAAISKGLGEAMSGMRSFGYTIVNYYESENRQGTAVETATHHVLKFSPSRRSASAIFCAATREHSRSVRSATQTQVLVYKGDCHAPLADARCTALY